MGRYRVGIVIPAFNEGSSIGAIVQAVAKFGIPIVVDDGSTDNTAALASQHDSIVVRHEKNSGYDCALNTGFRKAYEMGLDFIITLDADGQHDPLLIRKFLDQICSGADMVLGIRNKKQRLSEILFSWYTTWRFGFRDPLCGMKAYRVEIYKALGYFDSYNSIGTELMLYAALKGYEVRQIDFDVKSRNGSSKFGSMLLGNYKIFRAMIIGIWRTI
jgi:glycosyltransferase involved in cell wall biosynthesis